MQSSKLTDHILAVHEKIKNFICESCLKNFSAKGNLKRQIQTVHKSIIEEKKKCDFCDRTYSTKRSLYVHVNMKHSNAKNPQCETCSKEFRDKYV